ncbi:MULTISPECIES: disulfide bond formation protein B [unclassified Sphingomonas]|mgnify:FL=1|uniref:disulfide bond formation protein B n=1 Tax=unclassified Sphingomonas TaxID=196159 RepID=UPI00092C59CE|nr:MULTISPECIES: disulfide bond formation protein B [unclassified Sphingomonas]MBN8846806.1 disulfide bond formation protein B [Sphingomonas sp.]OJV33794.1 MAG: disulfide bond formation protein B [Sphingomonas sp. 67-36]
MNRSQRLARVIALLLPAALLAGAWGSQLIGGLHPCEMCHWQRWPHYAAVVAAALAFVVPGRSVRLTLIAGAAALIAVSGMIGIFHAGVEYHWWQGITACSTSVTGEGISTDEMLRRILAAPVVRCDAAQWRLFGISLAGFNAIFSLGGAGVIAWLLRGRG